jgi:hypothetical protein
MVYQDNLQVKRYNNNDANDTNLKSKINKKTISKEKYPKLHISAPLIIAGFDNYLIQESPDFNTSSEESETLEEEKTHIISKTRLDRIRNDDGTIDLGLNRSDLGKIDDENTYHNKKSRKMINYDGIAIPKTPREKLNILKENSAVDEYEIPFEFGDRGSTWRMMKLNKLNKRPSKSEIFGQYATLWDYELACLERDELESRKHKSKHKWVYKPSSSFIEKRKFHVFANKQVLKGLLKEKEEKNTVLVKDEENGDNENSVIKMKKYSDVKLSKSKRLKNELKLAHLAALDYGDDDYSLSREQVESLTNSP